jgi:hypothetical protein
MQSASNTDVKEIIEWHKAHVVANDIIAVWVFDGLRHTMKKRTDDKRAELRIGMRRSFCNYTDLGMNLIQIKWWACGAGSSPPEKTLFMISSRPSIRMALHISRRRLKERHSVLFALQLQGLVDYTLSEDGDTYALGSPAFITNYNYRTGDMCLLVADDIEERDSAGAGRWKEQERNPCVSRL